MAGASLAIGHHTLGRRHDRHTETVHDTRGISSRSPIDAEPRAADTFDALYHRPPGIILKRRSRAPACRHWDRTEVFDVAFVLQHLGDRYLHLRGRHATESLFCAICALRMRVSMSLIGSLMLILYSLLPASLDHAGHFARKAELAQLHTSKDRTCGIRRADARSAHNGCADDVGLELRGNACSLRRSFERSSIAGRSRSQPSARHASRYFCNLAPLLFAVDQ
jgi:hypothetical protein